jgi:ParB family chromosome partitioning protein
MSFDINISELKPHPINKKIYGEEKEEIAKLAKQIKKSNHIADLIINQDNVIISGHRRYYACLILDKQELPCKRITFKDENEEIERLLLENQYRDKTTHQKLKETDAWKDVEQRKAKERQATSTGGNNPQLRDRCPQAEVGKTRDIIAERVGLGSGRTYERAKPVVEKIDELKEQGNDKDAKFLITVLNESVRGASDLAKLKSLDDITEEVKDQVISKELPVQKAVQTIRKDLGIITDGMRGGEKKVEKKIEKICSKCGEKKPILEFYSGRAECRNCHNNPVEEKVNIFNGVDMYALEADIKNLNKRVDYYDYETITMEIEAAITVFIFSIESYVNSSNNYEDMDIVKKENLLKSISDIENTINNLKNKLI